MTSHDTPYPAQDSLSEAPFVQLATNETNHTLAHRIGNAALSLIDGSIAVALAVRNADGVHTIANGSVENIIPVAIGGLVSYSFARGAERRGKAAIRGTGDPRREIDTLKKMDALSILKRR